MREMTSGENINVKYSSTLCDQHKNKPIEIYCLECKTAVCSMCYIKDHNAHDYSDVAAAADDLRSGLTRDIQIMSTAVKIFGDQLETIVSKRTSFLHQVQKPKPKYLKELIASRK